MKAKQSSSYIILFVIVIILIMAWVDLVLQANYAINSAIKLILFLLIPLCLLLINRQISFRVLFHFNKKQILFSILLGLIVYIIILGVYYIIRRYIDFSNIVPLLENRVSVNKENFIFVSLYISFINSFLEEFFFRGIAFLTLKKYSSRILAYLFSAGVFSVYHIAIMVGWFEPLFLILILIGLFGAGLMFNRLNEKNGSIYTSWIVHMCANFAINTIGFILFGII